MAINVETEKAKLAALKLMFALVELVAAEEQGTPSGPLYAALMTKGCSYTLYTSLIDSLTSLGWIRQSNNCLFATDSGRQVLARRVV